MNGINSFINTMGDILGTSKLAQLNRTLFRPVLGTGITRTEYDMCNGAELFEVPDKNDRNVIKNQTGRARESFANDLLSAMVKNNTVFTDSRIEAFVAGVQTRPGSNPIGIKVMKQMSSERLDRLQTRLSHQMIP